MELQQLLDKFQSGVLGVIASTNDHDNPEAALVGYAIGAILGVAV